MGNTDYKSTRTTVYLVQFYEQCYFWNVCGVYVNHNLNSTLSQSDTLMRSHIVLSYSAPSKGIKIIQRTLFENSNQLISSASCPKSVTIMV